MMSPEWMPGKTWKICWSREQMNIHEIIKIWHLFYHWRLPIFYKVYNYDNWCLIAIWEQWILTDVWYIFAGFVVSHWNIIFRCSQTATGRPGEVWWSYLSLASSNSQTIGWVHSSTGSNFIHIHWYFSFSPLLYTGYCTYMWYYHVFYQVYPKKKLWKKMKLYMFRHVCRL
jgi:hypothetical protein